MKQIFVQGINHGNYLNSRNREMQSKLPIISLMLLAITPLVGCVMTDKNEVNESDVILDNVKYTPDGDGAIVLSKSDLKKLAREDGVKFIQGQYPNVKLTETEYNLVKMNDEALFSLAGQAMPDAAVATLIRPGSFKENIERIVNENYWKALYYQGPDFYIENLTVLEEENVIGAVMSLASDFPVYTCFDETERVVTVIKEE